VVTRRLYLYDRFERFWHWTQALLVLGLLVTGLEVHGSFELLGYRDAVSWHERLAWSLVVLVVFAAFWHFTTGEWRQYLPSTHKVRAMIRFYVVGIFHGEPHPTAKTRLTKLNPLQRLAYLSLKILVFPVQLASGFAYLYRDELAGQGLSLPLGTYAFVHTAGAFALLAFVIGHVYLTTTGHTPTGALGAMVTGWEVVEDPTGTTSSVTDKTHEPDS
jgi:thiosulfate reductase cytochrome b subunit